MGIPVELFIDTVDNEFICSICLCVLEEPLQDGEDHLFCKNCIHQWLDNDCRCPLTRRPLYRNSLRVPSRILMNILYKLKMMCPFNEHGCNEIIKWENYQDHVNKCLFNTTKNPLCEHCSLFKNPSQNDHDCMKELKNANKKLNAQITTLRNEIEQKTSELTLKNLTKIKELTNACEQKGKELENKANENSQLKREVSRLNLKVANLESKMKDMFRTHSNSRRKSINKLSLAKRQELTRREKKWNPSTLLTDD